MKNDNMFQFGGDEGYTSKHNVANDMEDIVSDTKYIGKGKHYARAKRRKSKFGKIGNWWRSRKKWQRVAMTTVGCIVLTVAIVLAAIPILLDYNYNNITGNPEDLGFENVINSKIVNVALFGIDSREKGSFTGRSDSIMILSINTETKKVKVISVMRDTLAEINYDGKTTYGKINSAYAKGGPELAIKTLNEMFKLDISEYATVNFYGMADIIDAVDGIDATITDDELNVEGYENGKKVNYGINGMIQEQCGYMDIDPTPYYLTKAGEQHLNGIQAVAYARIRHAANADGTNNDQGRTDRQRYVMEQLFNKATTMSKSKYVKLAKALIPCSETSLSYSEIMSLAVNVLLHSPKFEQTRVPMFDYQMNNVENCVYFDRDYAAKLIHAFIYDDITPEDYIAQNGVDKNDWYGKKGSSGTSSKGNSSTSTAPSNGGTSSNKNNTVSIEHDDDEIIDNNNNNNNNNNNENNNTGNGGENTKPNNSGTQNSSGSSDTSGTTSGGTTSGEGNNQGNTSTTPSTPSSVPETPSQNTPVTQE